MNEATLLEILKAFGDQLAAEKPFPVVTVSTVAVAGAPVLCVLVNFTGGQYEAARVDLAEKNAEKDLQAQLKNVKQHAARIRQMAKR